MKVQRALISVSDKTGIVTFAKELHDLGVEILSTGGTLKALQEAGIPAIAVQDVTGFPEMMDGRVKTLHPRIHGGILAIRENPEHVAAMKAHDIRPIDLVVVNLYPFAQTIARPDVTLPEAIENIDIGGPSMVRSAGKNNAYVGIVVDPKHYEEIIAMLKENGELSREFRLQLAQEAFQHTALYDCAIANYLARQIEGEEGYPAVYVEPFEKAQELRYGENPHQTAAFYRKPNSTGGIGHAKQLHGKELSYNNIVDIDAAWNLVSEFTEEPAVAIIKHTNPCGMATADTLLDAYKKAFEADSVSAFGGIVALNRPVTADVAEEMKKIFFECILAPSFEEEAAQILETKKNIRLLEIAPSDEQPHLLKRVTNGLLIQSSDDSKECRDTYEVVTKRQPTEEEWKNMEFAWKVVKHVKSNAIVVTKENQTLGVGAGQMNRVGSAKIALEEAGEAAKGAALASDAFFPFGDTVEEAAKAGITCIIQPGGSIRDEESIVNADKYGIAMVFTKTRHFKH